MKISQKKYDELSEELKWLETEGYKKVMEEKEAAGGPMESFHQSGSATEEYIRWDTRVRNIKKILSEAEIIDKNAIERDRVMLGCRFVLSDGDTEFEYELVSRIEADPLKHKISEDSAVGAKVVGKKVGDSIEVELPIGVKKYRIISIK